MHPYSGILIDDSVEISVIIDRDRIGFGATIHTEINIFSFSGGQNLGEKTIALHINKILDIDGNYYWSGSEYKYVHAVDFDGNYVGNIPIGSAVALASSAPSPAGSVPPPNIAQTPAPY